MHHINNLITDMIKIYEKIKIRESTNKKKSMVFLFNLNS